MTVIAWDGKSLAADRQCTWAGIATRTVKIIQAPDGVILAHSGPTYHAIPLFEWWQSGAAPEFYPKFQDADSCSELVVVTHDAVLHYARVPTALPILDDIMAWGSGRDFALGAMAMGADARQAVSVASRFHVECGFGVDCYSRPQKKDID